MASTLRLALAVLASSCGGDDDHRRGPDAYVLQGSGDGSTKDLGRPDVPGFQDAEGPRAEVGAGDVDTSDSLVPSDVGAPPDSAAAETQAVGPDLARPADTVGVQPDLLFVRPDVIADILAAEDGSADTGPLSDAPPDGPVSADLAVQNPGQPDAPSAPLGLDDAALCPPTGCQCILPDHCPSQATACRINTCSSYTCGVIHAPQGTLCQDNNGDVCDGQGNCVDHCNNGVRDFDETDTDCGGQRCDQCQESRRCFADSDCISGICGFGGPPGTGGSGGGGSSGSGGAGGGGGNTDDGGEVFGICQPPSCSDQVSNGDETGVDCGGSCPPCDNDIPCQVPSDCISGVCATQNLGGVGGYGEGGSGGAGGQGGSAGEIDGGAAAIKTCQPCNENADCAQGSLQCLEYGQAAVVGDTICSQAVCVPCSEIPPEAANVYCALLRWCPETLGCDVESPSCVDHCQDHMLDPNETDVDCGGSESGCARCPAGRVCNADDDCEGGLGCNVQDGTCISSCLDGHMDGDETGVDCGGSCPLCYGASCSLDSECASQLCIGPEGGCGCTADAQCPGYCAECLVYCGEGNVCYGTNPSIGGEHHEGELMMVKQRRLRDR